MRFVNIYSIQNCRKPVLKNGKIQEYGSFGDLIDKKGFFYSIYTIQ